MKDPAFLFYPNDYIGGTLGMTFEQKGAYIELLMTQFNRGHMTSHMIGQVLGQSYGQVWETIKDKFQVDDNGSYYNERLEIEQNKRKAYTQSRRNNRDGVNQHTNKEDIKVGHMTSHMENRNRDINIDSIKEYYKEQISNFEGGVKIKEYEKLVNFLFGENKEKLIFKNVLKMEEQLSYSHFEILIKQYKLQDISAKLRKMENYDLLYKSKGVYLTLNNWMV